MSLSRNATSREFHAHGPATEKLLCLRDAFGVALTGRNTTGPPCSSVATGGAQGGTPPLPSTGMVTGFVQIRGDFFRGGGWGGLVRRDNSLYECTNEHISAVMGCANETVCVNINKCCSSSSCCGCSNLLVLASMFTCSRGQPALPRC